MPKEKEYILRGDAINIITMGISNAMSSERAIAYSDITRRINAIPSADVEPVVRATWKDGKCTNCDCFGFERFDGSNEYTIRCPNCGAHMERSGSGE